MPSQSFEFRPAITVSVGAVGRPGQRVFYLQASDADQTVSLKLEKMQVAALASAMDQVLDELEQREAPVITAQVQPEPLAVELVEESAFVVGQIALAYDPEARLLMLVVQELTLEEGEEGDVARIWMTAGQMRALSHQAKDVVAQGRPICPICERPIDPDGHFCPGRNGHSTHHEDV
jgi:uncharacterized repeat protein (TIGR03847 family)